MRFLCTTQELGGSGGIHVATCHTWSRGRSQIGKSLDPLCGVRPRTHTGISVGRVRPVALPESATKPGGGILNGIGGRRYGFVAASFRASVRAKLADCVRPTARMETRCTPSRRQAGEPEPAARQSRIRICPAENSKVCRIGQAIGGTYSGKRHIVARARHLTVYNPAEETFPGQQRPGRRHRPPQDAARCEGHKC